MATHCRSLAQRIPWTEGPGSLGVHRVTESDTTEATWHASTQNKNEKQNKHINSLEESHYRNTAIKSLQNLPINSFLRNQKSQKSVVKGQVLLLFGEGRKVKVAQSSRTLCDSMDYTVHGILQAKILKWLAFPFSKASSQPRD